MKEVKAFIRAQKAEQVIDALEQADVTDITLIDVMGLGNHMADPETSNYSVELVNKYSQLAKIEIVCTAADVDKIVETIQKVAYTGLKGDGMIYVSPVELAVKIRTGARGSEAI